MAYNDRTDFRPPLAKVRGLGSAKEGTEHFIKQRASAASNLILVTLFIGIVVALVGDSFLAVRSAFTNWFVALVVLGTMLSVTYHMRLGMQVIIEDYVHGELARPLLLLANTLFALAIALACAFAVLKMAVAPDISSMPVAPATTTVPAPVAPAG